MSGPCVTADTSPISPTLADMLWVAQIKALKYHNISDWTSETCASNLQGTQASQHFSEGFSRPAWWFQAIQMPHVVPPNSSRSCWKQWCGTGQSTPTSQPLVDPRCWGCWRNSFSLWHVVMMSKGYGVVRKYMEDSSDHCCNGKYSRKKDLQWGLLWN